MKVEVININNVLAYNNLEVRVSHDNDFCMFSLNYFGRNSFDKDFDVFEYINKYWETLTFNKQSQIFECYKEMAKIFDTVLNTNNIYQVINEWSVKLLDHHDLDSIKDWIFLHSNISIPANFKDTFEYNVDTQNSPMKTYTRNEFFELLALTIVFKTMVPIWGSYISQMKHGKLLREQNAFMLISGSSLMDSVAYNKLYNYVFENLYSFEQNKSTNNKAIHKSIVDGISGEDFPMWVLSRTVIKRISISDIRGLDPEANIVTFIHKFISQSLKPNEGKLSDKIQDKEINDDDGSGADGKKFSMQERYRVKYEISEGEVIEIEHSLKDHEAIAFRLSKNMTKELYEKSLHNIDILIYRNILPTQMTLLKWILKPVISPNGLMYVDKSILIKLCGVVQAVLWARGHKFLSLLATCYANVDEDTMLLNNIDSRAQLPKPVIEKLDEVFPYQRKSGGKKTGYKSQNLAKIALDNFVNELISYSWISIADESFLQETNGNSNRKLNIPYDIKILTSKLIIELGERNWN